MWRISKKSDQTILMIHTKMILQQSGLTVRLFGNSYVNIYHKLYYYQSIMDLYLWLLLPRSHHPDWG